MPWFFLGVIHNELQILISMNGLASRIQTDIQQFLLRCIVFEKALPSPQSLFTLKVGFPFLNQCSYGFHRVTGLKADTL